MALLGHSEQTTGKHRNGCELQQTLLCSLCSFPNLNNWTDLSITQTCVSLAGVLSLDTSRSSTTKGTVESKVNVLLTVYPHNEGWHIHNLLANPEVHRQPLEQG